MGKPILILQHVACEGPGTILGALSRHRCDHQVQLIFRGDEVPTDITSFAGLIIMGGPMGVGDTQTFPHLAAEVRLVEQAVAEEVPVLGICLGSQMLAHALGARVYRGERYELGWYPVTCQDDAANDPLFSAAPDQFVALHWHRDVFDLPDGAVSLASSELTACQAFRFGLNAYGLLFHLEATGPQIDDMLRVFSDEVGEAGANAATLRHDTGAYLSEASSVGDDIFDRWAGLLTTP